MSKNSEEIYKLLVKIPRGKVTTYKELANKIGIKSYRGVGQILKHNPNAPEVPCHRVVKTNGDLGGYAGTNTHQKAILLENEGVTIRNSRIIDLEKYMYYL